MAGTNSFLVDQRLVDQLARLLNIAYSSAFLYGSSHPTTRKNVVPFFNILSQVFQIQPMVSFIISQEMVYVDDLTVDKKIGMQKLIQQFTKTGIASVSFDANVRVEDIEFFIKLSGDSNSLTSADVIVDKMQLKGVQGIRLNYVRYGKITNDEKIVNSNSMVQSGNAAVNPVNGLNDTVMAQVEQVLSLSNFLDHPQKASKILSDAVKNDSAAGKVNEIFAKLKSDVTQAEPQSLELLLNAIYELKLDLSDAIEVQRLTGKIITRPDTIKVTMNDLTCDVILKLVKEEYASGKLGVKRLAHIILRMLPDPLELKQILPRLKELLLKEGMTLPQYLEFIRMLDVEIESDDLAGSLNEAAKGIGVSVTELVEAIKKEPQDTAKLIILAAEIRQGTYDDDAQLSGVLSDYIEKISTNLALQSNEITGPQGSKVLKKILLELENQFLLRLKTYGVEMPVLAKVKEQLSQRLNTVFETAVSDWMTNVLNGSEENSHGIEEKLRNFMSSDISLPHYQDTLAKQMLSQGYQTPQIESFFKRLTRQIALEGQIILPPSALASNNMLFLLNREIRQRIRYGTSFSTLMISIKSILKNGEISIPTVVDLQQLLPALFDLIKTLLREIDLIGTTGEPESTSLFVILSMTDADGALTVKKRIIKACKDILFSLQSMQVSLVVSVSVTVPDTEATKDLKSFLAAARKNHQKERSVR